MAGEPSVESGELTRPTTLSSEALEVIQANPEVALFLAGLAIENKYLSNELEAASTDCIEMAEELTKIDDELAKTQADRDSYKGIAEYLSNQLHEHDPGEIDDLTGLLSLKGMTAEYKKLSARSAKKNRKRDEHTVGFIDLDEFKAINEVIGNHDDADEVLKHVADVSRKRLRADDLICHRSGDEFIFILLNTSLEEGVVVAEDLLQLFQKPVTIAGQRISPRATVAIDTLKLGTSFRQAISPVNHAVMRSKVAGRKNRVIVVAREAA